MHASNQVLQQHETTTVPLRYNTEVKEANKLYTIYATSTKKHLKMNKEIGMILPKKELIQVE